MKPQASPGLPFMAVASTNAGVVESHRTVLVEACVERLSLLARYLPEDVDRMSAWEKVNSGLCDPVRLFVKQEPHKKEKLEEKRVRLISSVSLVDQVVERFLYNPQNTSEILRWREIPSRPGMSLGDVGAESTSAYVAACCKRWGARFADSDMSGWDWSVQGWEFWCDWRRRVMLMDGVDCAQRSILARMMANRHLCLASSLMVSSSGHVYEQTMDGIMKSGSYLTSSMNSFIRSFIAALLGARWSISMGDDAVEDLIPGAAEKYKQLGHSLKSYVERDSDSKFFEFCSTQHLFESPFAGAPANWAKTLYQFLCAGSPRERSVQLFYELRHHPLLSSIEEFLACHWAEENAST